MEEVRVVPRAHPPLPFSMFILLGLEANGFLAFQGRHGIASVVRWNLRRSYSVSIWGAFCLFFSSIGLGKTASTNFTRFSSVQTPKTYFLCLGGTDWPRSIAIRGSWLSPVACLFTGTTKYQPFWVPPLSIKHPPANFSLQNVNWHPPTCKSAPSKKGLAPICTPPQ